VITSAAVSEMLKMEFHTLNYRKINSVCAFVNISFKPTTF